MKHFLNTAARRNLNKRAATFVLNKNFLFASSMMLLGGSAYMMYNNYRIKPQLLMTTAEAAP
jgi:hypothetical protein